jgi:hypothetical protein
LGERVRVDAVQGEGVEVEVQIERRAELPETLDEGDGTALLGPEIPLRSRTSSKLCEQGADEGAEHGARDRCVVGTAVPEQIGQCEHPLPNRYPGQHAIDEMRGGVRHATPAARRAEAAALAGKRKQAVVTTVVAVESKEAVRQDAATQECAKLLLDEAGRRLPPPGRTREESFQLFSNHLVEERLLRLVALVLGHRVASRDRRGGTLPWKVGVIGARGIGSLSGSLAAPASVDQPLVECEWLGLTNREPAEIRMAGVQQEVVLSWDDC